MEKTQRVVIKNKNGVHTRVAAMVARQAQKIEKIWDCQLYLRRPSSRDGVTCNSVLPLVSLKIRHGELVEVYSSNPGSEEAVFKLASFLSQTAELEVPDTEAIDNILQENTLASEKIFESINNGLIAMDSRKSHLPFRQRTDRRTNGFRYVKKLQINKIFVIFKFNNRI